MYPALAFLLLFFSGARLPLNRQFRQTPGGVPIFVVSNGFHTDIVVPLREPRTGTDWLQQLGQPQLTAQFAHYRYAAFGWGSERFYLKSYGGRMPGVGTVLRAAGPGPTLMHVGFYPQAPQPGKRVVALQISTAEYQRLASLLQESFAPDSTGAAQLRNAAGYTSHDFFFRAQGRYHALHTCNDWTVRTLRRTGLRVPLKSPLAGPVLRQLRRSRPGAGQAPQ
ncbi:TIGR02117 family protein [Hymenobacter cellulosilyticus]|uniref:TIGR02117 family protein n=1 Tax=Hymenobacter cellulosilyticus TaxID=2932248 RepID=A0A8T9PYG6_9BACT|nr:TIGR02117 family protein [Hymenobacter cellulosilyticus]UOQ70466.1 TIGR02117 family protein [Hymenobacter cellulosilyticus]